MTEAVSKSFYNNFNSHTREGVTEAAELAKENVMISTHTPVRV